MIQLRDVTKTYDGPDGSVNALAGVSLEVAAGDFVAVTGHSGCGKTTLLMLVGALAQPTSGEIVVAGNRLDQLAGGQRAEYRATKIGFVFQTFHLVPYLDVMENVLSAARPGERDAAAREAAKLIERFGLNSRRHHRPGQLSAGERQRTALARALVNRPPIVLADEPTGNLDTENAQIVLDILSDYHRGGGVVILATHDEDAASRATRRVRLRAGAVENS